MMRITRGAWVLCLAAAACGGHYEVGTMNGATQGGSASGATSNPSDNAGTGAASASGASATAGAGGDPKLPGNNDGRLATFEDPSCVPSGQPSQLTGPFASPDVVWSRIAMLTYGEQVDAPNGPLPAETDYDWAGNMVQVALADANQTLGGNPGAEVWLRRWLGLPTSATFDADWAAELPTHVPAPWMLLQMPFGTEQRAGVFMEKSFLSAGYITARGYAMQGALFGQLLPPPPPGESAFTSVPGQTDRETLTQGLANPSCGACHQLMDPMGYALGHFDRMGDYRALDQGLPIDTSGDMMIDGVQIHFEDMADFATQVGDTCAVATGIADSFSTAAFALSGGPAPNYQLLDATKPRVEQSFVHGDRTYAALVTAYIQSPAGLYP